MEKYSYNPSDGVGTHLGRHVTAGEDRQM